MRLSGIGVGLRFVVNVVVGGNWLSWRFGDGYRFPCSSSRCIFKVDICSVGLLLHYIFLLCKDNHITNPFI